MYVHSLFTIPSCLLPCCSLLPAKIVRDWKIRFLSGHPLHDDPPVSTHVCTVSTFQHTHTLHVHCVSMSHRLDSAPSLALQSSSPDEEGTDGSSTQAQIMLDDCDFFDYHVRGYTYVHVHMYVHVLTYVKCVSVEYIYVCTYYVHVYIRTYVSNVCGTHVHTHICTTYTYIHIYVQYNSSCSRDDVCSDPLSVTCRNVGACGPHRMMQRALVFYLYPTILSLLTLYISSTSKFSLPRYSSPALSGTVLYVHTYVHYIYMYVTRLCTHRHLHTHAICR